MDLDKLLKRYLNGKCSQEEKKQLYELLTSSDNERSFKEALFSHLSEFNEYQSEKQSDHFDRLYNKILSELKHREIKESEKRLLQKRFRLNRLVYLGLSTAAVFCIAFFLGTLFNQKNTKVSPKPTVASSFSEVKAPLGARSEVRLADGTEVILNAGSSIIYNSDYNLLNRDIALEGEAYFKVAKDINIPLVVNAGNIKIRATGTEFNVKAYPEEKIIETTLIEGKVEISQTGSDEKDKVLELTANQKAIYTSELDQITLEKIREIEPSAVKPAKIPTEKILVSKKTDVDQATAWTKNKLIIRSENLESLCIKLQRKYDVMFVFADEEIKKHRFSGILLDETLQQVMDVIKLTAPVDYLLDGKTVLLYSNKENADKYAKRLKK